MAIYSSAAGRSAVPGPAPRLRGAERIAFALLEIALWLRHPRLVRRFRRAVGYWPRIAFPALQHEKYLWRKLFDRDPRFHDWTDKLAAKEIVRATFPDIAVPETLWTGVDTDDIPDAILSDDCIVKANNGSGWNHFVRTGAPDRAELRRKAAEWMQGGYGESNGEWGYRDIEPRLYVEALVTAGGKPVDREYKCYVAAGELLYVYVMIDRHTEAQREAMFDADGNAHVILLNGETWSVRMPKPKNWEAIVATAKRLGADFDFVRVDLYDADAGIAFQEMTFYSQAGYDWIDWPEMEDRIGRRWDIRKSWFMRTPQPGLRGVYRALLARALDRAR